MRKAMALVLAAGLTAAGLGAQEGWTAGSNSWCEERWGDSDRERACRTLERTVGSTGSLTVDGGRNGGISVEGWDRDEISVTARIWAHARDERRVEELLDGVRLEAGGGRIAASGPSTDDGESWGVSWEVRVPRRHDLTLEARNGGLAVAEVEGRMDLTTRNGGVHLTRVAGDVRARTTNGGLDVELDGATWRGAGLDAETRNGGIDLEVPDGYSAVLETGTVNGGLDLDFPVTVRGRIDRQIRATLGDGGPTVRVVTTNGGVRVRSD